MYTNEKTVEKFVCSRTELNKCTQCLHGRRTQTNTVQCAAAALNIAQGLYVSTRPMAVFHKSEYMYINLVLNRLKYVRRGGRTIDAMVMDKFRSIYYSCSICHTCSTAPGRVLLILLIVCAMHEHARAATNRNF